LPGLRRRPKSIPRKKKPNWSCVSDLVPDIKKTAKEQEEQEENQEPQRKSNQVSGLRKTWAVLLLRVPDPGFRQVMGSGSVIGIRAAAKRLI
jgi:hypothetical protein